MINLLTKADIENICNILSATHLDFDGGTTIKIASSEAVQNIVLTIYYNAQLDADSKGVLISAQTQHGYFEIHNCTNFFVFEPDEVIFVSNIDGRITSLIIGKEATCSLFANVQRSILSSDFAQLDPAVLLSAMQLSLTETILD